MNRRPIKHLGFVSTDDASYQLTGQVLTMGFKINNFADQDLAPCKSFNTPTHKAHGYTWSLKIFPRGDTTTSNEAEGYVSWFLCLDKSAFQKGERLPVWYQIRCNGTSFQDRIVFAQEINRGWGFTKWIRRSDILDPNKGFLDAKGTLTIEIDIDVAIKVERTTVWYPELENLTPVDFTEQSAMVTLEFCGKDHLVHSALLEARAPTLFEMLEEFGLNKPVQAPAMDQVASQTLIRYIYGHINPKDTVWTDCEATKKVLLGADQLGSTLIKLYAESVLVEKHLTMETAIDLLLFADSHSCGLLKETTMSVCVRHGTAVTKMKGWNMVEESSSLVKELLVVSLSTMTEKKSGLSWEKTKKANADANSNSNKNDDDDAEDLTSLDVATLRNRMLNVGMALEALDGSRETLVKTWQDHVASAAEDTLTLEGPVDDENDEEQDDGGDY